jgi:WD40 repeat protein
MTITITITVTVAKSNASDDGDGERRSKHKKNCCCFCSPDTANDDESSSCPSEIPLEILVDHIAPFLDRRTYNSCLLLCRRAQQILVASWWKRRRQSKVKPLGRVDVDVDGNADPPVLPPWPRKIVARDPSCRVRCLTFSEDNVLLSCGCSDGKIRTWDVRMGELPMPREGHHWPDEAVVALAYGNKRHQSCRLLASSSTDGTIRVWRIHSNPSRTQQISCFHKATATTEIIQTPTKAATSTITTTTKRQKTSVGDDDDGTGLSPVASFSSCILCIPADHAVSLHFSPDDSYLVSGHLRMRNANDALPTSTIEIREVRTGLRLRRLEDGGVPIGFVPSLSPPSASKRLRQRQDHRFHDSTSLSWEDHYEFVEEEEEEHRLISTCGPNTCLKLWSWNRTRFVISDDENEDENENYDPNILNYPRSNHSPIDENTEQRVAAPMAATTNHNSNGRVVRTEQYKTVLDGGQCIQQRFLDRFNTVLPVPAAAAAATRTNHYSKPEATETTKHNNNKAASDDERAACEILVAVINEPSSDSFSVWNTSSPKDRRVFRNTSPYEIRFSPDGSKIASVDDFNTVKVWRISDGVLLKTFSGEEDDDEDNNRNNKNQNINSNRFCNCHRIPVDYGNGSPQYEEEEEDSDETSVSYVEDDCGGSSSDNGSGIFPIHELVFSKDSSTVAVISRCYNEVHLFST